jgi:hypothetical protein
MKKHTTITLFLMILALNSTVQASQEKRYSAKKYPYDLLLTRTDSVKIIYNLEKKEISCKVEVNWKDKQITSMQARVTEMEFSKEPLASCLPREKAKNILAKTFE